MIFWPKNSNSISKSPPVGSRIGPVGYSVFKKRETNTCASAHLHGRPSLLVGSFQVFGFSDPGALSAGHAEAGRRPSL